MRCENYRLALTPCGGFWGGISGWGQGLAAGGSLSHRVCWGDDWRRPVPVGGVMDAPEHTTG